MKATDESKKIRGKEKIDTQMLAEGGKIYYLCSPKP